MLFVVKETFYSLGYTMKNKRFIVKDNGTITIETLSNIRKYHYRLIQDVDESNWNFDDPSVGVNEGRGLRDIIKGLRAMNIIANACDEIK